MNTRQAVLRRVAISLGLGVVNVAMFSLSRPIDILMVLTALVGAAIFFLADTWLDRRKRKQ